jgi:hypothetical protein
MPGVGTNEKDMKEITMRSALIVSAVIVGLAGGTSAALAQAAPGQTPGQRSEQPTGPDSGRSQPGQREPGSPGVGPGASGTTAANPTPGGMGREGTAANASGQNSPGTSPAQTPGQRAEQPSGPDSGRTPPGSSGTR